MEEIEKYENCVRPLEYGKLDHTAKENKVICPAACDFQDCLYKCFDKKLNSEYYNPNSKLYNKIIRDELDYTTFTNVLKKNEHLRCSLITQS